MGTTYRVEIVDSAPSQFENDIITILQEVNDKMSTYQADSELSCLNQNTSQAWIGVSKELMQVLQLAEKVSQQSNGAFDVTVGPLVNLWGFGPSSSPSKTALPDEKQINALLSKTGYQQLVLDGDTNQIQKRTASLYIDLSAIAKGHAVDRIASYLERRRVQRYLVEIGGEIKARGYNSKNKPWRIAVQNPGGDQGGIQQTLALHNAAVATSGDYRNYYEIDGRRYAHTIDPRTGRPIVNRVASVTVVHASSAYADAMATALMVLGLDAGLALAEKLELKVLFLVKQGAGFEAVPSSGF